jgi:hypothetical protein
MFRQHAESAAYPDRGCLIVAKRAMDTMMICKTDSIKIETSLKGETA